jgi:hypothetical protein
LWFLYAYIDYSDLPSRDGGFRRALMSSVTSFLLLIFSCIGVKTTL